MRRWKISISLLSVNAENDKHTTTVIENSLNIHYTGWCMSRGKYMQLALLQGGKEAGVPKSQCKSRS